MKTKVLIGVPYHERKRYCLDQLYASLEAIRRENVGKSIELEIVVRHDLNPFGQKDNVKKQREFFRNLALSSGADFLFFHGADTIPPADVIDRLMQHGFLVTSGVYFQRGEKKAVNAIAWREGWSVEQKNEALSIYAPNDPTIMVGGFGLDCCLIARPILQRISFMQWDVNDDDYPFCDAVKSLGHVLVIDRTAQCKHWETENTYSFKGKYLGAANGVLQSPSE